MRGDALITVLSTVGAASGAIVSPGTGSHASRKCRATLLNKYYKTDYKEN